MQPVVEVINVQLGHTCNFTLYGSMIGESRPVTERIAESILLAERTRSRARNAVLVCMQHSPEGFSHITAGRSGDPADPDIQNVIHHINPLQDACFLFLAMGYNSRSLLH